MAKLSRLKESYRKNSSKLHRLVGDVLKSPSSSFSGYKIYQEYPVNKINKSYDNSRHKFDWVVLDIKLVIECHGKQHYEVTNWGNISNEEAIDQYQKQKIRDQLKQDAAIQAGYTYIVIPYNVKEVTTTYIWDLYKSNFNVKPITRPKVVENLYREEQLTKASNYRKEQYKKKKEFLNKLKREKDSNES
jgi:hypothetical protein